MRISDSTKDSVGDEDAADAPITFVTFDVASMSPASASSDFVLSCDSIVASLQAGGRAAGGKKPKKTAAFRKKVVDSLLRDVDKGGCPDNWELLSYVAGAASPRSQPFHALLNPCMPFSMPFSTHPCPSQHMVFSTFPCPFQPFAHGTAKPCRAVDTDHFEDVFEDAGEAMVPVFLETFHGTVGLLREACRERSHPLHEFTLIEAFKASMERYLTGLRIEHHEADVVGEMGQCYEQRYHYAHVRDGEPDGEGSFRCLMTKATLHTA